MVFAFFRLFFIMISTFVVLALAVFTLRSLGSQQKYAYIPHPLLEKRPLVVAWGGDDQIAVPFSLSAFRAAAEKHFVLGVDLRLSLDGVWFVYPSKYLHEKKDEFLTHINSSELAKLNFAESHEPILPFASLLKALPKSEYYLVIENPATPYLENLFNLIEAAQIESAVIISSPFYDTTKFSRERGAKWITDSTTAEIAKAHLFSGLFLESLISNTGEVITLDHVDERLMAEMRKRHLAVLLRTDDANVAGPFLDHDQLSGVVTSRPNSFLPRLH